MEKSKRRFSPRRFGAINPEGTLRKDISNKKFEDFGKRNKRSVWTSSVARSGEGHFAVFSEELILPAILASTSDVGCCSVCGKCWKRIVRKVKKFNSRVGKEQLELEGDNWEPACGCATLANHRSWVLDPFCGISTTGVVCFKNNLNYVGIDINEKYIDISRKKLEKIEPIFSEEIIL